MIWLLVFLSFVSGGLMVLTIAVWSISINDWRPYAYTFVAGVVGMLVTAFQLHG